MQILTCTRVKNALPTAQQKTKVLQCFPSFSGELQRIWGSVPWPVLRKTLPGLRLRWGVGGGGGGVFKVEFVGGTQKCPHPPRIRPIWVIKASMSSKCWCSVEICVVPIPLIWDTNIISRDGNLLLGKREKSLINMNTQVGQWQASLCSLSLVQSKYLWQN